MKDLTSRLRDQNARSTGIDAHLVGSSGQERCRTRWYAKVAINTDLIADVLTSDIVVTE